MPNQDQSTPPILRPQGAQQPTVVFLPTRGEKRLIPSPIDPAAAATEINDLTLINQQPSNLTAAEYVNSFDIAAALEPLTDFITVVLQNRGLDAQANPDGGTNLVFRFLINPKTVDVGHSTLEGESFARSGWLFGIWGEDLVRISLSGVTAGQYFALGLTDQFAEYTESFRNLEQLIDVFENNGYFFEGEQADSASTLKTTSPVSTGGWSSSRRLIKMHQDVILTAKEFIWYGMFETLSVSQDANNPFLANFTLTFLAWKERFRGDSPYWNSIQNNVQRGNSYTAYQRAQQLPITVAFQQQTGDFSSPQVTPPASQNGNTTATSPAAMAEKASDSLPQVISTALDYSNTPGVVFGVFGGNQSFRDDMLGILGSD